jgi:4-hydroxy-3-methylbut-2-enyl diphosphate reductase
MPETKPPLQILLAGPRGFCAGVDRAIKIVEEALNRYGAPVYVRHEIVHNRFVVESLEAKGAVFVEELHQVPAGANVVFSAHGVPKSVPEDAKARNLIALDATCPLVSKVHREVERHAAKGRHLLLIGHAGHVEVIGTMGQVPDGTVTLIEDAAQARSVQPADRLNLAYATQTTLSVDDTAEIVEILRARFPAIEGPKREDICYATTNRQAAVRAIAAESDLVLVIGAPNSSNSLRLVEVALRAGAPRAQLIRRGAEVAGIDLSGVATLGLSAGASAPEMLVDETIAALRESYTVTVREIVVTQEDVTFRLPAALTA